MKKLNTAPRGFDPDYIKKLEFEYDATFIIEVSDPSMNGDVTRPMAVFYMEVPHPRGSNYFGVTFNHLMNCHYIRDALPHLPEYVNAVKFADGMYYHSSHRHDYMKDAHSDAMIDGGQDYCKTSGCDVAQFNIGKLVTKTINEREK